jgi:signal transduction histidine kinase
MNDRRGPMRSMMVLLVDDQPIVGEAIRRMLADAPDLSLHYCADPLLAVQQAEEIRPTVILQDLVMPQADGLDIVRHFRAMPATADIPIVVLSSKEDPQVKSDAFAAGANDYLVKLPDRRELIARVRYHSDGYLAHLERDEAMRALRESQRNLLQSNTELLTANHRLNQFVGMAAHDLRNPLTVILGFGKFLTRDADAALTPQHRRFLDSMLKSTEFMLRLVNNLLDTSRIEAGELQLDRQPTDLAALLADNIALNEVLAAEKDIEVRLELDPGLPTLSLDADKIEQVVNNLVSNAIKFSPPHTVIRVSAAPVGGDVHLHVRDQGPGIPHEEQEKLFKPFGRTSVRAPGEKSTGLGLFIARQVVEGHGGRIWVEGGPGEGTSIGVALPLHVASASSSFQRAQGSSGE